MANSLGIDFNPQPAYGSDPFSPIVEGANLGFGLVQNVQQIKKQQQDVQAEQEKAKLLKFGQLTDVFDKFKNEKNKAIFYESAIRPAAKQFLGVDFPEYTPGKFDDYLNAYGELVTQYQKNQETKGKSGIDYNTFKTGVAKLYAQALQAGETDTATQLKTGVDLLKPERGQFRQVPNRVTDQGLPLMSDSSGGRFFYVDPQTGEDVPYNGQQFPAPTNPSSGAESDLRDVLQQRGLADKSLQLLTPDKVGYIDKKFKTIGSYLDKSTDPEAIYFRSLTELANTIIRKNFYGATLTNNEQKAFADIAANRNLSPKAFTAQVQAMQFAFNKVEDAIRSAASQANRPFRQPEKNKVNSNDDPAGLFK